MIWYEHDKCVCVCVCVLLPCMCATSTGYNYNMTTHNIQQHHDKTRTCLLLDAMMCLFSFLFATFLLHGCLFSFLFSTGSVLQVRGKLMPSHEFMPRKRSLHLAHHCQQSHLRWCARRLCVHVAVHVAHQCACTTCTTATHRMMHGTTTSPPPGMDDGLIWSCDTWTKNACQVSWCNVLLPIGPVFKWSDDDALCPVPVHRSCYAWFTPARPGMSHRSLCRTWTGQVKTIASMPWHITTDGCMLASAMVSCGGMCLRRCSSGCSGQENKDSARIHNDNHDR
jgi:hypothetical protein